MMTLNLRLLFVLQFFRCCRFLGVVRPNCHQVWFPSAATKYLYVLRVLYTHPAGPLDAASCDDAPPPRAALSAPHKRIAA